MHDMFPDYGSELPDDVNCCETSDETDETDDESTSSEDVLESQFEDEEKFESDKDEDSEEDTMSEYDEIDEALAITASDMSDSGPKVIPKKRHHVYRGIPIKRKRLSGLIKNRYRNKTMKFHKSNKSSEFDVTDMSSESGNDETPNNRQHCAEENNVNNTFNPIASSTINSHNDCEINMNQNSDPPQGLNFQNEYIIGRLKSMMDDREPASLRAKNEVKKIKEDHAKEVKALTKLGEEFRDKYNQKSVELYFEKQRAQAASQKLTAEHDEKVGELRKKFAKLQQDKGDLCKELKTCHNDSIESRDNHVRTLCEIRDQQKTELELERMRSAAAMEQLKLANMNEMTEFKNKIITIREQYEAEKQCADVGMKKLKMEHSQQIAELEHKVKTAIREKSEMTTEATERIAQLERGKEILRNDLKTTLQKLVQTGGQKQQAIAEIHQLEKMIQISQNNHNKSIMELEQRLKQKIQHTIELMMDKKGINDEMKKLKSVYSQKIAELEHKVTLIEAKLKLKSDAFNNYKLKMGH